MPIETEEEKPVDVSDILALSARPPQEETPVDVSDILALSAQPAVEEVPVDVSDILALSDRVVPKEATTPPPPSAAVQSVTAGARVLPEHQAPPSDATPEERQAWRRREMAQVAPVETLGSTIEKLPGGIREAAKVGIAANALSMGAVKGIAPFGLGEKIPLPDVSDMPLASAMEAGGKLVGNLASFVIPGKLVSMGLGKIPAAVRLTKLAQSGHRGAKVVLHGLQTIPTFVAQGQLQAPITMPAADRAKIAGESALSGLMFSAAGALGEIPVVGKYVAPTALLGIAAQQSQNMTQFAENAFLLLGLHLMGVNSVVRKRMANEAKQTMTGLGVPQKQADRIINDAKTIAIDPPPNLVEIRNRAEAQRLAEIEATKAAKQATGAPIAPEMGKVPAPAPIAAPAPVPAMETARPEPLQATTPTPLPPQPAPTPSGVPVGKEVPSAGTVISSDLFPGTRGKAPTLVRVRNRIAETEAEITRLEAATEGKVDVPTENANLDKAIGRLAKLRELGARMEEAELGKGEQAAPPPPLPLTDQLAAGTPVTPPKTAAFLRVTDAKGNEQVVAAKDADTLKGAGPFKTAEWGNRRGMGKREFVPLEEKKVTVAEPSIRELKAEADDMELPTAGGPAALKDRIDMASKVRAPRRRGILSKTGAAGLPKEMRLGDKARTVDKEALEVEAMFDWQDEQIRQKFKPTWQKTKDALRSATWAVDEPIQRRLERAEGGRDVLMARGKLRGVSTKILQDYKTVEDAITRTLPEELDKNFGRVLQAKRTIEATKLVNEDRGRQPELELDMADTLKSTKGMRGKDHEVYLDNLKRLYPEQWPSVEKALAIRYAANETLVDRMVAHDLISAEFGDYLKKNHKNYSQRWFIDKIDPDLPSSAPGGTPTSVPDSGVKKLDRGSEGAMISNWRTLLADQVARTEGRIAKNDVNRSLYDWAKATPDNALGVTIAPPGIETAPSGKAAIRVMIKGQPVTMFMPSELAQYWTNADPIIRGHAATILQWASGVKPLKATATGLLAPEFALVNMPMDFFYKWLGGIGEYSSFLPKFVAQSMADYKATARDAATSGPRVKAYIDEYGGMDFLSKAGLFGERKPWEVGVTPAMETLRQVETLLSSPAQISEMWGRLAFRERALKNITAKRGARIEDATPQERFEATQKARNTLDFSQGGTAVKALDNVMAYLSAGVQGGRGILRAFRTRPAQATWQAAQLMAVAGALTYAWRKTYGDLYDKIPLFDRVGYWIVPIMKVKDGNGEDQLLYARIRKDPAVRVFAAFGDAFADKASGKDVDGSLVREAMAEMNPAGMSTITSPTVSALLSYSANKDFWRNKDIWRGARVSPEMEVNRDTPAWLAAGAGKLAEKTGISISPERSRVAAQRVIAPNLYTGTLGVLSDTVMPDNPAIQKTMLEKIVRLPGARKILKMTKTYELTKRQEGLASKYKIDRTQPHSQIVKQIESEERAEADAKQTKRVGYWKAGNEPPKKKTTTLPRGATVRMPR